jgi:hypothetical protein
MTSDPSLKRLYRTLNRRYFAAELPDVELWWEPCGKQDGAHTLPIEGSGNPPELMIRIDPFFMGAPQTTKLKLLHEMVHVKLWPERGLADHGKRFDQEIARLCSFRSYRKLL